MSNLAWGTILYLLAATASADAQPTVSVHHAASFDLSNPISIEQTSQGTRPAPALIASFDGLGFGFTGPQGAATGRNPSDNSLAAGPNHVVEIVNSRMAVYTKTGKVLYGAAPTNTIFKGFGGPCEARNNGDAVVRYDQLAERWLFVMPLFQRIPDRPEEPYSVCYAVSIGADPLGPYYRYEFRRKLFPDYPRPAIWTDGYYMPTSTGDNVVQKHACVVDREKMLRGGDATEQCIVMDGVNFLNNADIDGPGLPPPGAPNIMMATGGTQLKGKLDDDGIYVYKIHVDWKTPANTAVSGPVKIAVAPYHYLCGGQLTNCVPQPDTTRRLDAQGDKLMQRLVYRNFGGHESIVALHSVDTAAGGGGVRWYEFRLDANRDPYLYQQGTYAPDGFYRWMGSIAMDRQANIAMGYSFGGPSHFPGQRFVARMAGDPRGVMGLHEAVLVDGEASQTTGTRWEDYTTTAIDPTDDCTFWYSGDYIKKGATSYTTRIGAFRLPGCRAGTVSGAAFFDLNHNGRRDPGEPGIPARRIRYTGGQSGDTLTDSAGNFLLRLPADKAFFEPTYTIRAAGAAQPYTVTLADRQELIGLDFAAVCTVRNTGAADLHFWSKAAGKAALASHDGEWQQLLGKTIHAAVENHEQLRNWLRSADAASAQLAIAALNTAYGKQNGDATVHDPVVGDWPSVRKLISRLSELKAADLEAYKPLLTGLNSNSLEVTPSTPARCEADFTRE